MIYAHRHNLNRREILTGTAAGVGLGVLSSTAPFAQAAKYQKHRRHEISDPSMPPQTLVSYKKAIREMLKRSAGDPLNWYRNAFLHLFDCPHGNWWFLAWHRAYLGWFERKCRELSGDPNFALPYWDWTKTPRVPAKMFEDELDPNHPAFIASFQKFKQEFEPALNTFWPTLSPAQKSVLAGRGYNSVADILSEVEDFHFFNQPNARGLTATSPDLDPATQSTVAIDVINSALQTPTFTESGSDPAGFASAKTANHNDGGAQGILESEPHNNVHGGVGFPDGGFMWGYLSPVDPIFFLHHANIDRLWDVWTRRQDALGRPALPEGAALTSWSNEQFLFFSDEKGTPATKTKAGDYATMSAFDYDYSPGSAEDQVPAATVAAAAAGAGRAAQQFDARVTAPSLAPGQSANGAVDVPVSALARAADAFPPTVVISLNLTAADRGRRFQVVATPAAGGKSIDVGAITMFGHPSHDGPTIFSLALPESLGAAAASAAGSVAFNFAVTPLEGAAGESIIERTTKLRGAKTVKPSPTPQLAAVRVLLPKRE